MARPVTSEGNKMKPQQAAAIDVFRCDGCGNTHVVMLDDNGDPFAEIALDEGETLGFGDQVCTICEDICDGIESQPDTIGPTSGSA